MPMSPETGVSAGLKKQLLCRAAQAQSLAGTRARRRRSGSNRLRERDRTPARGHPRAAASVPTVPETGRVADIEHRSYAGLSQCSPCHPQGRIGRCLHGGVNAVLFGYPVGIGGRQCVVNRYAVPSMGFDIRKDIADPLTLVGVTSVVGCPYIG